MRPDPGTPISAVVASPRPDDDLEIVPVEAPTATYWRDVRVATTRMTRMVE
jgi:hypothetical protein